MRCQMHSWKLCFGLRKCGSFIFTEESKIICGYRGQRAKIQLKKWTFGCIHWKDVRERGERNEAPDWSAETSREEVVYRTGHWSTAPNVPKRSPYTQSKTTLAPGGMRRRMRDAASIFQWPLLVFNFPFKKLSLFDI